VNTIRSMRSVNYNRDVADEDSDVDDEMTTPLFFSCFFVSTTVNILCHCFDHC